MLKLFDPLMSPGSVPLLFFYFFSAANQWSISHKATCGSKEWQRARMFEGVLVCACTRIWATKPRSELRAAPSRPPTPTQVPPLRHSWDWVHYSVGVGSSCEWREMASCTVCVVAPPTLLSMGNQHKILQIRDFNCQTEMDRQPEEWLMVKGERFPGEGLILDDWMCLFVLFES